MYYDKFTVSACQMDCENKLARDKCSCLNINMPKKDDGKSRNVSKLRNLVYLYYLLTMGGSNGTLGTRPSLDLFFQFYTVSGGGGMAKIISWRPELWR